MVQSDNEKKINAELAAIKVVLRSPEWGIFRDYVARYLRKLWAQAVTATMDEVRAKQVVASEALVCFLRDFEIQEAELESYLTFEGLESDSESAEEMVAALRALRSQPRPYRDPEEQEPVDA